MESQPLYVRPPVYRLERVSSEKSSKTSYLKDLLNFVDQSRFPGYSRSKIVSSQFQDIRTFTTIFLQDWSL